MNDRFKDVSKLDAGFLLQTCMNSRTAPLYLDSDKQQTYTQTATSNRRLVMDHYLNRRLAAPKVCIYHYFARLVSNHTRQHVCELQRVDQIQRPVSALATLQLLNRQLRLVSFCLNPL